MENQKPMKISCLGHSSYITCICASQKVTYAENLFGCYIVCEPQKFTLYSFGILGCVCFCFNLGTYLPLIFVLFVKRKSESGSFGVFLSLGRNQDKWLNISG